MFPAAEPTFLYNFGDFGIEEGQFNYPTDIALDREPGEFTLPTGRIIGFRFGLTSAGCYSRRYEMGCDHPKYNRLQEVRYQKTGSRRTP